MIYDQPKELYKYLNTLIILEAVNDKEMPTCPDFRIGLTSDSYVFFDQVNGGTISQLQYKHIKALSYLPENPSELYKLIKEEASDE